MSSNFNCSYMARSSLTYIPVFFCEIFLSADLYRLCKLGIFWNRKKGGWNFKKLCLTAPPSIQDVCCYFYITLHEKMNLTRGSPEPVLITWLFICKFTNQHFSTSFGQVYLKNRTRRRKSVNKIKNHIKIGWKIKILFTFQICEI